MPSYSEATHGSWVVLSGFIFVRCYLIFSCFLFSVLKNYYYENALNVFCPPHKKPLFSVIWMNFIAGIKINQIAHFVE